MLLNIFKEFKQKKTTQNLFHLGFENIFRLLVSFVLSVFVARQLGPEYYGQFTLVISFSVLFQPFFISGIEEITISNLIFDPERHNKILGTSFIIKIVTGFMAIFLCLLSLHFLNYNNDIRFSIMLYMLCMFFHSFAVINNYYQSKIEELHTSKIRTLSFVLTSIIKIVTLLYTSNWLYFVYISCFEVVSSYLFMIILYSKNHNILNWRFDGEMFFNFLKKGVPYLIILFCDYGIQKIDQLMISSFLGAQELAFYAIPVKLISLWSFFPTIISSTSYPRIIEYIKNSNFIDYNKSLSKTYGFLAVFSICLSVGTFSISKFLITLLYGQNYLSSISILSVYCFLPIFSFFHFSRIKIFIANNRTNLGLILTLIILLLNIILNYFFIPKYGVIACAYVAIASFPLANLILIPFSSFLRHDSWLFISSPFRLIKSF